MGDGRGDLTTSVEIFRSLSPASGKKTRALACARPYCIRMARIRMVVPFAHIPLARIDAFVPALQTVMCIVDLITAVLLFAQYSIVPKRPLPAVACGYVFSGLFAFLQTLAFPGTFPNGLNGRRS